MPEIRNFEEVTLSSKTLVLTPNSRLAKYLKLKQLREAKPANSTRVNKNNIAPLGVWLHKVFQSLQFTHPKEYAHLTLLKEEQSLHIWRDVISSIADNERRWFLEKSINTIADAYNLQNIWKLDKKSIEAHFQNEDTACYVAAMQSFREKCKQKNVICQSDLYRLIQKHLSSHQDYLFPYRSLCLYGFDEIQPALSDLLLQIESSGVEVSEIAPPTKAPTKKFTISFDSFEDEISEVACWAKTLVNNKPESNIAVVIPSLNENRNLIEESFLKVLSPETISLSSGAQQAPFNITSGNPLPRYPIIAAALLIIDNHHYSLLSKRYDTSLLIENFKNPLIFTEILSDQLRYKLILNIEKIQRKTISKANLKNIFDNTLAVFPDDKVTITELVNLFVDNESYCGFFQEKRSYANWSKLIKEILQKHFWLNQLKFTSEQYQLVKRFFEVVDNQSLLDTCSPQCEYSAYLSSLKESLNNDLFQKETIDEENHNILICGMLEAAAQDFTHLWICEFNNENWPGKPKPNPFLPITLQKTHKLPHADAERERNFSQSLLNRYEHHCDNIFVSHARFAGDQEVKPSPFSESWIEISKERLREMFSYTSLETLEGTIKNATKLCNFNDNLKTPLKDFKQKGGQSILQTQSRCPFAAFSKHRLNVDALPEPQSGLNAINRGEILHHLFEAFWRKIRSQNQLLELNEEQLKEQINHAKQATFKKYFKRLAEFQEELELECYRGALILSEFLEIEKKRSPFTISRLEHNEVINIQGLTLNLRVDRIDTLEQGQELIIDYKTGLTKTSSWLTPRMEEPQLPLYASTSEKNEGIAFAILRNSPAELGFKGISGLADIARGIEQTTDEKKRSSKAFTKPWSSLQKDWQLDLNTIASSFIEGETRVMPKARNTSCTYCDYQSICRVQEVYEETS